MSNNTDAFVSHNLISNSDNINGYCFVYRFIDDRILFWGLSVCDKSNQYDKKLARTLAFQHMQNNTKGFSGVADIGAVALDFIKTSTFGSAGIWKYVQLIPEAIHPTIVAMVNRHTYPVRNMTCMMRKWIVRHSESKGLRAEYSFLINN